MEARLVEFARVLRQNGVRVSPAEVADAARAAALVGLSEREAFRSALRSTMAKRAADVVIFDRVFDLYFSGLGRVLGGLERSLAGALEEAGLLSGDDLAAALRELAGQLSPLARAALAGDAAEVGRLLRAAALEIDFSALQGPTQLGFYGRRLLAAGGGGGLGAELAALERALAERGLDPAALELVSERLALTLRAVEEAARRWAELEQRSRAVRRHESFATRSLASLTPEEIARTETAVRRLAERLKSRLVKRERSRRRGTLSVRRTLRRNLGLGGVPARLAFRHRRPERPDVVVLCDVSDSVRHVSRMMLLFLYTLQSLFTRVRSFVFVSDLGEVTEAFRAERDVSRAADLATAGKVVSLAGNSNYGRALRVFHRDFAGSVTRRTTVIVIGDGRTNYHPPEAWVLKELSRKARRVVWICPEERWAWGSGDSEMPLYAACAERVAVVTRLADLEEVAEALVPRT
ncbi:MAG TPA: VWA domain-containing protein [Anaeromyxobacteraceae bacterium]|nr:VWA domain-containing protein [Anaeromyxobacteraceae bacterium]